ncbi:multidrug ABC transporter substrate-binding protein [Dictyobacter alpinus]|uniref:Multidrug ABC transporter substrate-binding protein n=1 Tax=Dictyobacter alpinus TaxID=2014873 RepID=A0A402B734_9CHLR|nr:ABC transporter permease [Dictyobacter alpinus]GCE27120.1 multidrug ABC transporter substrate-binding protein [Dictyobacter alpinus]
MSISEQQSQQEHAPKFQSLMPPIAPEQRKRGRGSYAIAQSLVSAIEALRANKLRSLLTSLGIIIGVAAVIMMVATSEGNAATINGRLSTLNPNQLNIRGGSASTGGVRQGAGTQQILTQSDADQLATQVPGIAAVSPTVNVNGQVIYQNQNWSTSVQGVYPNYQQVGSWQLQEGNFFTSADEQSNASVAVLGQTVVDNLFTAQGIDPLGRQIRIGSSTFTVVGVLATKGANGATNADDTIFIPFSTANNRLGGSQRALAITVLVAQGQNVTDVQANIQQFLQGRHDPTEFTIQNQGQLLQTVQTASQSLTILLISVAAISLIVGGIGIMNIMLVSVTERTREIGIRIALGAYPRDVMAQFLIEALILSALGGIVGILLGILGAFISASLTSQPLVIDPLAIVLSFTFAALVGIIFGFYPAQRAARMDPINALRTE